jgi:hypothetical protein
MLLYKQSAQALNCPTPELLCLMMVHAWLSVGEIHWQEPDAPATTPVYLHTLVASWYHFPLFSSYLTA